MTEEKPKKKKRQQRRTGQRTEIVREKKYVIRVFLGKDSVSNKRRYFSEVFYGGAKQADDRIRELIRRHRAGEPLKASADAFESFLDEWIEAKRLSVAESSLKTYTFAVDRHIKPALGKKILTRITSDDVQRLYGKMRADGSSRGHIQYVHAVLNMIFKLAVKRKKLIGSPMAGVEIPKAWTEAEDEKEERAMTPEQVAKFLEAAKGTRFEHLFTLAFHVGCRPSEMLGLRWTDLDTGARTLRINQNLVWRKADDPRGRWYLKKPKTRLSRRTLPLTDVLIEALKEHRKRQLEERMKAGKLWNDHNFVFCDKLGEPFTTFRLNTDFKQVAKAAGLPDGFSPYTMRHSMATILIATGTNPKAVSERLGHSTVVTTLREYVHFTNSSAIPRIRSQYERVAYDVE